MRRYFTPRCLGMHLTLLVLLPAFAWLTWWQLHRALSGNTLSWAYTFEWPLFAGYAVFVWWQLIHDEPTAFGRARRALAGGEDGSARPEDEVGWALNQGRAGRHAVPATGPGEAAGAPPEPDDDDLDPELAEYNRYLRELNAGPDPRHW